METLMFGNHQTVNGKAIETADRLFLYMNGITLAEAFGILINSENIGTITAKRDDTEKVFAGYTNFYTISEDNGVISAGLKK